MGRLILTIIAIAMAIAALKLAIIALLTAGLIFRTKETVGLLLIGGAISLVAAYPPIVFIVAGLFVIAALIKASKSDKPNAIAALEDRSQA